ncbi:hypothetical protein AB1N83_010044 [Pleurotus pulmonarius]
MQRRRGFTLTEFLISTAVPVVATVPRHMDYRMVHRCRRMDMYTIGNERDLCLNRNPLIAYLPCSASHPLNNNWSFHAPSGFNLHCLPLPGPVAQERES